jgi:hypothetical protein
LPPAVLLAAGGYDLTAIAAVGVAGELVSLLYVALRLDRMVAGLGTKSVRRALFLAPVAVATLPMAGHTGAIFAFSLTAAGTVSALVAGACLMPATRSLLIASIAGSRRDRLSRISG